MTYILAKIITGFFFVLPGIASVLFPLKTAHFLKGFPRNKLLGQILSAVALLWSAALIYFVPIDFLMRFRIYVVALILVSIPLSWKWMSDLLAARSLGGLWSLLPAPIFVASRFQDGWSHLIIIVLMYVVAVAGMVVTFSPNYLRDAFFWVAEKPGKRLRPIGVAFVILGIASFFA